MEHKTLSFEIKSVDYAGRTLEGFAAAFGNLDQVGDVIHPGAFRKTLTERGQRIKFLWQHDPTEPIGKLLEAHEQQGGLFVKAIISDTNRGRDALALLKDGAIGEMSIGYDTVKGGMDYTKGDNGATIRNLREIKLYEFSLVTFPANEQAIVTSVKQDVNPTEAKPWRAVRNGDKWEVYKLDADGDPMGESLGEHDSEEQAAAQVRALYASESKPKAGDPPAVKAGRTISRATYEKLKAARDVIDELCAMGVIDEDEDEKPVDKEVKSATIIVTPDVQAVTEQSNSAAGPVQPPTDRLLKLIELELSDLQNY